MTDPTPAHPTISSASTASRTMETAPSAPPPDGRGTERGSRRKGIFIPFEVLIWSAIVTAGATTAGLAATLPAVGLPLGVGVGVASLLYAIYTGAKGA